jgi:hypothetical protein
MSPKSISTWAHNMLPRFKKMLPNKIRGMLVLVVRSGGENRLQTALSDRDPKPKMCDNFAF